MLLLLTRSSVTLLTCWLLAVKAYLEPPPSQLSPSIDDIIYAIERSSTTECPSESRGITYSLDLGETVAAPAISQKVRGQQTGYRYRSRATSSSRRLFGAVAGGFGVPSSPRASSYSAFPGGPKGQEVNVLDGVVIYAGDNVNDTNCMGQESLQKASDQSSHQENFDAAVSATGKLVIRMGSRDCGMLARQQNMMDIRSVRITYMLPSLPKGWRESRVFSRNINCSYPSPRTPPDLRPHVRLKVTRWVSPLPLPSDTKIYLNDRINLEFIPDISWYSYPLDGMPLNCRFLAHDTNKALITTKPFYADGCGIQEQLSNGSKMELFGVRVNLPHAKRSKTSFAATQHIFNLGWSAFSVSCDVLVCTQDHMNGVYNLPMCPRPCSKDLWRYANDTMEVSSKVFRLSSELPVTIPHDKPIPSSSTSQKDTEDPPRECPDCPPLEHHVSSSASLSIKMTAIVTFISFALGVTTTAFLWFLHNKTRRKGSDSHHHRAANEAGLRLMTT